MWYNFHMNIVYQFLYGAFAVLFLSLMLFVSGGGLTNLLGFIIVAFLFFCVVQKMYKNLEINPVFKNILIVVFVYFSIFILYDFAVYNINSNSLNSLTENHNILYSIFKFLRYLKFGN